MDPYKTRHKVWIDKGWLDYCDGKWWLSFKNLVKYSKMEQNSFGLIKIYRKVE